MFFVHSLSEMASRLDRPLLADDLEKQSTKNEPTQSVFPLKWVLIGFVLLLGATIGFTIASYHLLPSNKNNDDYRVFGYTCTPAQADTQLLIDNDIFDQCVETHNNDKYNPLITYIYVVSGTCSTI